MTTKTSIPAPQDESFRVYVPVRHDVDPTTADAATLARASHRQPIDPSLDETVINYVWPRRRTA